MSARDQAATRPSRPPAAQPQPSLCALWCGVIDTIYTAEYLLFAAVRSATRPRLCLSINCTIQSHALCAAHARRTASHCIARTELDCFSTRGLHGTSTQWGLSGECHEVPIVPPIRRRQLSALAGTLPYRGPHGYSRGTHVQTPCHTGTGHAVIALTHSSNRIVRSSTLRRSVPQSEPSSVERIAIADSIYGFCLL